MKIHSIVASFLLFAFAGVAHAGEATIAVAANFTAPVEKLAEAFAAQSTHRVKIASGATGGLYTSIKQGAPYDLLLSADQARPQRLIAEGDAVPGSLCTYAVGRLALWSSDADRIPSKDPTSALRNPALRHVAIANPDVAPYGAAAREVLQTLGLWDTLAGKRVQGMDIGQTFAMVSTGNAELGFVAASALADGSAGGSRWDVPAELHAPLAQDVVLLKRAAANEAALAFHAFLGSSDARALIEHYGYARAASGACGA